MNNPNVQRYLTSLGLDPSKVMREGWNDTHYHEYVHDLAGKRIVEREWPQKFTAKALIEAMQKDGLF